MVTVSDKQALIAQSYQVEYFPTTYFIGRDGKVFKMETSNLDTATIASIVSNMVEESTDSQVLRNQRP